MNLNLAWNPVRQEIHLAGCAHLRMAFHVVAVEATDIEGARAELAEMMGWVDYPEDADGVGFDMRTAPCVTL